MGRFFRYFQVLKRGIILAMLLGAAVFAVFRGALAASSLQASTGSIWADVDETALRDLGERRIIPDQYRTLSLDVIALHALLAQAPIEFSPEAKQSDVEVPIPLPDGGYEGFRFVESPVMEPELAAKFPEIKTYLGRGIDDPTATVRFDWTQHGFHAMIQSSDGTVFIDPYSWGNIQYYISYFERDYQYSGAPVQEFGPLGDPDAIRSLAEQVAAERRASGSELRTYRTAIAATGEYTAFHGGTVPSALAEIVTALNRVTGIYEREVAVRMVLIANNNLIIYTDGATDPYTNNSGVTMLGENQTNLDAVIGNANYDVGHVFSTGGGGVASLGVPCRTGVKARGVTGLASPIGDPFYLDYVAHEMGHQFAANHTFNGNSGSCAGNRNASTAYEPGSGSTIMAYAGICSPQNIQSNSDDYFHGASYDEIIAYTQLGAGNTCAAVTATGNLAPSVNAGAGGYSIPIGTPFTLTGSASDPDSDPLTYNWEQFDLGPAGHPDIPVGDAPIFRSFSPVAVPSRTFPKMSDIVNNTHTMGELLPASSRTLTFRLTARDNHTDPSAGGVAFNTISFDATDAAGPFLVTVPNTAVTWSAGISQTVTWDVANTNLAPVNCTGVDILLSRDGGYTYPLTLLTNAPNNGSGVVMIPNVPINLTATARIKVACANNIFFDISDTNFTINFSPNPLVDLNGGAVGIDFTAAFTEDGGAVAAVDTANLIVADADSAQLDKAIVTIINLQDGISESLSASPSGAITAGDINYDSGTGVLTIDPPGTATLAAFETVLRTVTYNNSSQNPNTNPRLIDFLVHDGTNNNNPLARTTMTVYPVNDAPSFTKGPDVTVPINAGPHTFSGWATAMSPGPAAEVGQTLVFTLTNDNSTLFAVQPEVDENTGDLTFTSANDTLGSAVVTVVLQDSGGTANGGVDSFAQTFTITVGETNIAPVLAPIDNHSVDEGSLLSFTASASDANLPAQPLSYWLDPGAPAGAVISATTGVFSWTPSEAQGPGVYTLTVRASDSGAPVLSDTNTFIITVSEVNLAPVLSSISDQSVVQGATLAFTVTATDPDLPANMLSFSLDVGAPVGANIDSSTGAFTWTPSADQVPGAYTITVRVNDDGTPSLNDTVTFTINVTSVERRIYLPVVSR